jgi:RHS repeat-associated protein
MKLRTFARVGSRCLGLGLLAAGVAYLALVPPPARDAAVPIALEWSYDADGGLTGSTDAAGRAVAVRWSGPDAKGVRTRTRTWPDGSRVSHDYDRFGRLVAVRDGAGEARYRHDGLSRLVAALRAGQPEIRFQYDTQGRVKSVQVGGAQVCGYEYDFLGRLAGLTTPAGEIRIEHQRDKDGLPRVVARLPNGVRTERRFDKAGRLGSLTHFGPDGRVLCRFTYRYRPDGLLAQVRESWPTGEETVEYQYDNVQRLLAVLDSRRGTTSYRYDLVGNRLGVLADNGAAVASRFDWAGRLVEHRGQPCAHDAAGNLTGWDGEGRPVRCSFTVQSQLARVERSGRSVTYARDGAGRLLTRTCGADVRTFVNDPRGATWRPLLATDASGGKTLYAWQGNVPVGAFGKEGGEFFLTDHLGSVRAVTGADGRLVRRLDYDAFGTPREKLPGHGVRPGFAGLFYDADAGLYLTQARGYAQELGRFLQRDPLHRIPTGSQKGFSAYAYCGNDPVNYVDTNGCEEEPASPPQPDPLIGLYVDQLQGVLDDARARELRRLAEEYQKRREKEADRQRTQAAAVLMLVAGGIFYAEVEGIAVLRGVTSFLAAGAFAQQLKIANELTPRVFKDGENRPPARTEAEAKRRREEEAELENAVFSMAISLPSAVTGEVLPYLAKGSAWSVYRSFSLGVKETRNRELLRLFTERVRQAEALIKGLEGADKAREIMDLLLGADWARATTLGGDSDWLNRIVFSWLYGPDETAGGDGDRLGFDDSRLKGDGWLIPEVTLRPTASVGPRLLDLRPPGSLPWMNPNRLWQFHARRPGGTPTGHPARREPASQTSSRSSGGGSMKSGKSLPPDLPTMRGAELTGPGKSGRGAAPVCIGYEDSRSRGFSPMRPQRVGGVRLQGAGKALPLGSLKGVALDPRGRLVLLAQDDTAIPLPPLRLDDIVTIFCCVYDRGEAPFVSIDPVPGNPRGPVMSVRHDPGTKQTYVGWVLFEADRVMKTLALGVDNLTGQPVRCVVKGYQSRTQLSVADPVREGKDKKDIWIRWWISPKAVQRLDSGNRQLTLLDVTLQLEYEMEVMVDGKLRADAEVKAPPSAAKFAQWFTEHYDDLAREVRSRPPAGSGIEGDVAVFAELRRLCLVAAVAERLRDEGVPMPAWMSRYPVRHFPVPRETPTINTRVKHDRYEMPIFGGVNLTPKAAQIRTTAAAPQADALAPAVAHAVAAQSTFSPARFADKGASYTAVTLPGNDTTELGGLSLDETDLVVPLGQGNDLRLVRHYSSLADPADCLGPGWTFDLPRLVTPRRFKTGENGPKYSSYWRLTTPLNRLWVDFSVIRYVPELGAKVAVPDRAEAILGLTGFAKDDRIGVLTQHIRFRDGRRWHFDEAGRLLAFEETPWLRVFRRDPRGRIEQIEGWLGSEQRGCIHLDYDADGRLRQAVAGTGLAARYEYSGDGALATVTKPVGVAGYQYRDGLVSAVSWNGKVLRQFEYAEGGRLRAERLIDGKRLEYRVSAGPEGGTVRASVEGAPAVAEEARYDAAGRLVSQSWADGTRVECRRDAKGNVEATLTDPHGTAYVLTASADGRRETLKLPEGATLSTDLDPAGRPAVVCVEGVEVFRTKYRPNGLLDSVVTETFALHPDYRPDGRTASLLIAPRDEKARGWLKLEYDAKGRPMKVEDAFKGAVVGKYDKDGRLVALESSQGPLKILRDAAGRIRAVEMPAGVRLESHFDPASGRSEIRRILPSRDREVLELDEARRPTRIQQFDGSETRIRYEPAAQGGRRVKAVRAPNGLELHYEYDARDRLTAVNVGDIHRLEYRYDDAGRLTRRQQVPIKPQRRRGLWD